MRLLSTVLALALTSSAALAGDLQPLSPGAPAGVKKAQLGIEPIYVILGIAVVVGIAVAASSGSDNNTPAPPVTTS